MPQLELHNLTVRFGGLTAVSAVDCAVEPGQIYSIIGPNGAGKTTVFNAITGIYEPTEGRIEFEGRELRRPLRWTVYAMCVLVGLATGLCALLAAVNVDKLWLATIKRNYADVDRPFSYRAAWHDMWGYLRGDLAVAKQRGRRWSVVTSDGSTTLAFGENEDEAHQLRDQWQRLVEVSLGNYSIARRDDGWYVLDASEKIVSDRFDTRELAETRVNQLAQIGRAAAAQRRRSILALLGGMAVGGAGVFAVWNRSRRTPDYVTCAGLARTFQNIRLFRSMTVLENVITAMDRLFHANVLQMALRTPHVRRLESEVERQALEMLDFVGLAGHASELARSLAYGDQRRLEIARALATEPKLLLLDEPAAGMNPAETMDLVGLIQRIRARGITVLLIEHHMKLVMGISDRIAVLDYGVKIAEGTSEAVRSNPRVIAAYLGSEEVG